MKSQPQILKLLNELLAAELTAADYFFLGARCCRYWGQAKLAKRYKKIAGQEQDHAKDLLDRLIWLDGQPEFSRNSMATMSVVGTTIPEQLDVYCKLKTDAIGAYREGIMVARQVGDEYTHEILERIEEDEENTDWWISVQQRLIEDMGLENYLSQQI